MRTQLTVSSLQMPFLLEIRLTLKLDLEGENLTAPNAVSFALLTES